MTTTELIELLKAYEYGGATGKPREVMFQAGNRIIGTDGVGFVGSGDGLLTELYLSLPGAERKTGRWIEEPNCYYRCSECGDHYPSLRGYMEYNFCPNCGADMRGDSDEKRMDV